MNFFLEQIVSRTNHKHCNFVLTFICIIPMLLLKFIKYFIHFSWHSMHDTVLDVSCLISLEKSFPIFFACYTWCLVNFFLEQIVSRTNHKHCNLWYSTWGLHNFLGEKNLFPRFKHALLLLQKIQSNTKLISIGLGALSSLIRTILDLGLPHAAPMQGESLGTNQADIMAWPASPSMWKGLT